MIKENIKYARSSTTKNTKHSLPKGNCWNGVGRFHCYHKNISSHQRNPKKNQCSLPRHKHLDNNNRLCYNLIIMERNFNHLNVWLPKKLKQAGLTVEQLSFKAKCSRASLYYYMQDINRPETQVMVRICHVFGVPLSEGLRQYTPKQVGRPRGTGAN